MLLETAIERAKSADGTLVMPEGSDPRVQAAAGRLAAEGVARVLLIGGDVSGCETLDPATDPRRAVLAEALAARRERMTARMAMRLLEKPAYFAGALVAAGEADGMVAGAITPTRRIIEAGAMTIGLAPGVETPSSFFVMLVGTRTLIFADCALNVAPDSGQLADIAIASARTGAALLGEARVAMLSFSTLGSGAGHQVDRVREAVRVARSRAPELAIDGEFQADTALSAVIAGRKGAQGPVAGGANVLVFPSLEAGNIAYKLVQELAGAQAIGPFLQGFARPVCDLSRGASGEDIFAAGAVVLAMAAAALPRQGGLQR